MKLYFWNGTEFKNTAPVCLELHFFGNRYKIGLIKRYPKNGTVLLYKEKL